MELNWSKYTPGKNTTTIITLDTHTAGEPLRIVTGGLPELPGATILARRRYMQEHYDHIRKALMWEPRGHYNMYGSLAMQLSFFITSGTVTSMRHRYGQSPMIGYMVQRSPSILTARRSSS